MSVLKIFPSIEQESDQKRKKKKEGAIYGIFFCSQLEVGTIMYPLAWNKEKHNCIQHRNIINISTVERQCLAWISHAGSLIQSVRQPFIICIWVYTLPTISVNKGCCFHQAITLPPRREWSLSDPWGRLRMEAKRTAHCQAQPALTTATHPPSPMRHPEETQDDKT